MNKDENLHDTTPEEGPGLASLDSSPTSRRGGSIEISIPEIPLAHRIMFGLVPILIRLWPMVWLLRWMVILATLLIGSMVHMVFNGCLPERTLLKAKALSSIINLIQAPSH